MTGVAFTFCLLAAFGGVGQDDPVDELIERLGDEDPREREKAFKALAKIGPDALPKIRQAAQSKDPEVRSRAKALLDRIQWYVDFAGGGRDMFSGRRKGKALALKHGGGTPKTEKAVLAALGRLARHQAGDGSWKPRKFTDRCGKAECTPNPGADGFEVGVTGLALLAFLGAGHTHRSAETHEGIRLGEVVKKGLQYLVRTQDASGRVTPDDVPKYMYNHMLATLVLTEAYAVTRSHLVKDPARKAIQYTLKARNPGRGWRYSFRCGDDDSSVTAWGALVLRSAAIAGF